ncbi:unnamed protein product [Tuber melanosporum]|uniref:(Perigord truffle) hypothetical protein n=1 Tax=Tuber melanosporum (strain Mel28) TaxID=656061 RepID=D5G7M4_TUBMM|nr:uncharacterized protein GSTUM_00004629001 [Tuber melanosporum]CAZ80517.1 unnamed protein product [Tuber melanosporum]
MILYDNMIPCILEHDTVLYTTSAAPPHRVNSLRPTNPGPSRTIPHKHPAAETNISLTPCPLSPTTGTRIHPSTVPQSLTSFSLFHTIFILVFTFTALQHPRSLPHMIGENVLCTAECRDDTVPCDNPNESFFSFLLILP